MRAERAVVIGASIGGLLAARVLSERFERVVVLERDLLPPPGEQRKGVPQGRHAHALLARGLQVIEELFPGITDELVAAGALRGDPGADGRWFQEGGYHASRPTGITALLLSRPLLEGAIARRVRALGNVEVLERRDALGLVVEGGVVKGVRLIRRAPGAAEEVLAAELTVDASGRGSRTPTWLEAARYDAPVVEEVRIDVCYATRVFRRAPGDLGGRAALVVTASPAAPRSCAALAMEGDRWIVSIGGLLGERPGTGADGYAAFADGFAAPEVAALVRGAEPLGDPAPYRFEASVRRRYERLRRFPDGLLVCADAICSFNPVYGQGMTVAALQALALRDCLAGGVEGLARRFFRQAARVVDGPWSVSVMGDLRFPAVEGRRSAGVRFLNWYIARLHRAAWRDAALSEAFLRVAHMLAAPPSLLRPGVALRVLRGGLVARRGLRQGELSAEAETGPAWDGSRPRARAGG